MQNTSTLAEVEDRVSNLIHQIIYVSHRHVVYEAPSSSIAERCVELLKGFTASVLSKDGRWFVSVFL